MQKSIFWSKRGMNCTQRRSLTCMCILMHMHFCLYNKIHFYILITEIIKRSFIYTSNTNRVCGESRSTLLDVFFSVRVGAGRERGSMLTTIQTVFRNCPAWLIFPLLLNVGLSPSLPKKWNILSRVLLLWWNQALVRFWFYWFYFSFVSHWKTERVGL